MPPTIRTTSVTVMAPDPGALAEFYARLLGTTVSAREPDWAQLRTDNLTINVEHEQQWSAPVWPATAGTQHSTQHLDLFVEDLAAATDWALECGARLASSQPQDDIRVLVDPAGHPFCLFT